MDEDLRELERAVGRSPESADAHARLGRALVRSGERTKGLASLHRAAALGASDVRETLRELGAEASPWSHSSGGDARNSHSSVMAGPRRGEVVIDTSVKTDQVALEVPGHVLCSSDGRVNRLDGRTQRKT